MRVSVNARWWYRSQSSSSRNKLALIWATQWTWVVIERVDGG
jgi:hypothetical protein